MISGISRGGLYWTRTSDPIDVNDVLYQLSQQTKVGFPELPFAVIRHIRIGEGAFDESYHMVLPTEPTDRIYCRLAATQHIIPWQMVFVNPKSLKN